MQLQGVSTRFGEKRLGFIFVRSVGNDSSCRIRNFLRDLNPESSCVSVYCGFRLRLILCGGNNCMFRSILASRMHPFVAGRAYSRWVAMS